MDMRPHREDAAKSAADARRAEAAHRMQMER